MQNSKYSTSLALSPLLVHWHCSAFTGSAFSGFAALSPAVRAFWNGANDAEVEFPNKLRTMVNGRRKMLHAPMRIAISRSCRENVFLVIRWCFSGAEAMERS